MYGTVKNEAGMLFSGNNFKVVKKILKINPKIEVLGIIPKMNFIGRNIK